ncbi:SCO family protein [Shewanella sp. TC10]|uniref:SCO family protein n=1 Tax=Shewanella sp. TC10 TaxID=1419739 RepID=UPI00129E08C4|nr:SCO family protein [Shewanella sp. TC10]
MGFVQKSIAAGLILLSLFSIPLLMLSQQWFDESETSYGIQAGDIDSLSFQWFDWQSEKQSFPFEQPTMTYLFLGFLSCSEICPIRIQQLSQLERAIEQDEYLANQSIRFLFVSFDPENDTAQVRKQVIDNKSARFTSAILPDEDLMTLSNQLSENIQRETETINHVGNLFLLDEAGKIQRIYTAKQLSTNKMLKELAHYLNQDSRASNE